MDKLIYFFGVLIVVLSVVVVVGVIHLSDLSQNNAKLISANHRLVSDLEIIQEQNKYITKGVGLMLMDSEVKHQELMARFVDQLDVDFNKNYVNVLQKQDDVIGHLTKIENLIGSSGQGNKSGPTVVPDPTTIPEPEPKLEIKPLPPVSLPTCPKPAKPCPNNACQSKKCTCQCGPNCKCNPCPCLRVYPSQCNR